MDVRTVYEVTVAVCALFGSVTYVCSRLFYTRTEGLLLSVRVKGLEEDRNIMFKKLDEIYKFIMRDKP